MKIFISWSGNRSKEVANILCVWIRQVIQSAEPWVSYDIQKGTRWNEKISQELEETKVGIICLDKDNLSSEWILFEAGALSKTKDAHVCTFLLDISAAEIKPPLGQFQHTLFTKEEVKKLIHDINKKILENGEKSILEKDLDEVFEIFWPMLKDKLEKIQTSTVTAPVTVRPEREILEEILQAVRVNSQLSNAEMERKSDSERLIKLTNEIDSLQKKLWETYEQNYDLKGTDVDYASFVVGDRVIHARFGEGKIIALGEMGKASVEFEKEGKKQLLMKYAGLKKV